MKALIRYTGLAGIALMLCLLMPVKKTTAQPEEGVTLQLFYDEMAPYGQWIDDPHYGYVWAPDVAPGFEPYFTNGHWVLTEYGEMWVSDYPWGWAPFHYGRWAWSDFYGWVWVPDTVWGPAWVCWRSGGGFYGWAPLAPGIGIDVAFSSYYCPENWWVFVPQRYILSPSFHRFREVSRDNRRFVSNTTIINNTYINNRTRYVAGPRAHSIERATHERPTIYRVNDDHRPARTRIENRTVAVYRPHFRATDRSGRRPAPPVVANRETNRRAVPVHPQPMERRPQNSPDNRYAPAAPPAHRVPVQPEHHNAPARVPARPPAHNRQPAPPPAHHQPPQRMERPQPAHHQPPQRTERPQPVHRQPPQRMERPQPVHHASPPRRERPQPPVHRPQPVRQQPPQRSARPAPPARQNDSHNGQPRRHKDGHGNG